MKRIFSLILGALAMLTVALISAFITMRFAIHGREAVVPALTGLTVQDATRVARGKGLNLALENRFYSSDIPPGRVIAQDPPPGMRVRRDWPVRITESLGGQRVDIPDLTGESERAATVSVRRLALDLGTVAHLAVGGDPDVVIAQTPPANSAGVDSPRVSLLVSDDGPDPAAEAYVMPSLVGLTYSAAAERAYTAGLHLVVAPDATPPGPAPAVPGTLASAASVSSPTAAVAAQPPAAPSTSGTVSWQSPPPGRRVVRGDAVHIAFTHPAPSALQVAP